MATNEKIKLDITSAFDPGGFAKANRAVSDLGGEMKKGGKVANNLMGAFGDLGGQLGGVTSAISKLGSAFAAGGWIALAAAGVAFLVSKYIEAKEAAAKLIEEQKKAWNDNIIKNMEASLSALRSKHADIADEIERGAKAADRISKAYEELSKSQVLASNAKADKQVALLEKDRDSKMYSESDPIKKKALELSFEEQILKVKAEASRIENDTKISSAQKNVLDSESSLEQEKNKLLALKKKEDELQSFIDKSPIDEYTKKNPMPSQDAFNTTLYTGGGVMGVGGGKRTFSDPESYIKAMGDWWKKANEFLKPIEEARKTAEADLTQVRKEIRGAPSIIKSEEIIVDSKKEQLSAAKERGEVEKEAILKQIKLRDQTDEAYKKSLEERISIEKRIIDAEEKLFQAKEKEADRIQKRNQLIQNSAQAKSMGAVGWNKDQTDKEDAAKAMEKSNQREANWVANAKKRQATGAKLSEKELARIANNDEWDKNQIDQPIKNKEMDNIGDRITKGFFVTQEDRSRYYKFYGEQEKRKEILLTPEQTIISRLEDNLKELQKLNTNLENSLKVK